MIVHGTGEAGCSGLLKRAGRWGRIRNVITGNTSASLEVTLCATSQ